MMNSQQSRSKLSGPLGSLQKLQKKTFPKLIAKSLSTPNNMRKWMSAWPPLLFSGIKLTHVSEDWSYGRIQLNMRFWNQNMHGAAFGGTLYSMTDVLFGTLVARRMGVEYEAWTRTGTFQYLQPGRDGAYLEVEVPDEMVAWIKQTIEKDGYCNVPYTSIVKNKDGSVVGIGQQDLHVRPRGGGKRAERPEQALQPSGLVLESLANAVVWHCFKDQPEILTVLMSEQRRIPDPEEQMRHVVKAVLEKSTKSIDDLRALDIPDKYLEQ